METLLSFLGFSTIANSLWNTASYVAFIAIIIGVFSDRCRNMLITSGAIVLAVYAEVFLKNSLFATLQVLVVVSGILQWTKLSRHYAVTTMATLTVVAYVFLYLNGAIADGYALVGSLGLLGIAFGLVALPKRYGFLFMATGGVLLIIYAFHVTAWVFFFLNIFFTIANIHTWRKIRNGSVQ